AVVHADGQDEWAEGAVDAGADLLDLAAQGDPAGACTAAAVLVDGVVGANGIDGAVYGRTDRLGVAAPVGEAGGAAGAITGLHVVFEADGVDLRVEAVDPCADMSGFQARVEPPDAGETVARVEEVVGADRIDRVLDGRADLLGVAAQADPAGALVEPDGVVSA